MASDTLVFIPAWNEEENLPAVLDELRAGLPASDVLVVDDGSTDETAAVARVARRGGPLVRGEPRAAARASPPATPTRTTWRTRTSAASTPTASIPSTSSRACSRSCGTGEADVAVGLALRDRRGLRGVPLRAFSEPAARNVRPAPRDASRARSPVPRRDERDVRGEPAGDARSRHPVLERRAGGRVAPPPPRSRSPRRGGARSHARAGERRVEAPRQQGRAASCSPSSARCFSYGVWRRLRPAAMTRLVAVLGYSDRRSARAASACARRVSLAPSVRRRRDDVVLFSGWARRRQRERRGRSHGAVMERRR